LNKRPPTDIRRHCPSLHPKLVCAIHACLEPNVDNRCKSMEEFMAMIRDILPERRSRRTRRPLTVGQH